MKPPTPRPAARPVQSHLISAFRLNPPAGRWAAVRLLAALLGCAALTGVCPGAITPTDRGAIIETERYRATIRDGALSGFVNKLTGEEYLAPPARTPDWRGPLPSGLGTQHTTAERDSARSLFEWPWWEFPVHTNWPNQHFPDAQSRFTYERRAADAGVLTYRGLSNGRERFADEVFSLEVRVDAPTGDLLITPRAQSPRGGLYGCGFAVSTLAPAVTVEAPIFEGLRLDRDMERKVYSNFWPGYWDYAFFALNGAERGAVALWCQDAELKFYKSLFFRVSDEGLSLAVMGLNIPPFEEQKTAGTVTWRVQAFDRSWAQGAARFRNWRLAEVRLAPRPSWVTNISFMNYGMHQVDVWGVGMLRQYFAGLDLSRVVTWAPAVRTTGFDRNHANNTPYPGSQSHMAAYKSAGLRVFAYLQPMIMWSPDPKTDRERQAIEFSQRALARGAFLTNHTTSVPLRDYHNLGQPDWQRWFLDWVREYCQDYGFDGIYHDSTYHTSLDVRGLAVGGLTAPQGMARYFYRAATENPDTIHVTEHLNEVNSVGASLGLGCGIIWGVPSYKGAIGPVGSMNWQRIRRASPVSNALPGPQSAIMGFPHFSNFTERGPGHFHDGMEQMERRGDLAAIPLGRHDFVAEPIAFTNAVHEIWLDRRRAILFVQHGLRAAFPEDWDRKVLSYFRGADGSDFRYESRPWGSAFVEVKPEGKVLHYARAGGVTRVETPAGIYAWPCYNERGPVGLDPAQIYCLDPQAQRPPGVFDFDGDGACVAEAFASDTFSWFRLRPLTNAPGGFSGLRLRAAAPPATLWVDGVTVQPRPLGDQLWEVPARADSLVVAAFREIPPGGFDPETSGAVSRMLQSASRRDLLEPRAFRPALAIQRGDLRINPAGIVIYNRLRGDSQTLLPLRAPVGKGNQTLRLTFTSASAPAAAWNGQPLAWDSQPATGNLSAHAAQLALGDGQTGVLSLALTNGGMMKFDWKAAR